MELRLRHRTLAPRLAMATAVVLALSLPLGSVAQAAVTVPFRAKMSVELSPGIKYQLGTMKTTGGRRVMVRVGSDAPADPWVRLKALLSNDRVIRRDVVRRMALLKRRVGFRPIIGINGDGSVRDRVDEYAAPHSMAVSGGELMVAQACARPSVGVDADGNASIDNVRAHVTALPPGYEYETRIHKVNTHRDGGHVVLYTPRFASRTRTAPGGVEVVLDLQSKLMVNGAQTVRVLRVRRGGGNTPLKAGQAVLSVKNPKHKWVYALQPGQQFRLQSKIVRSTGGPCADQMPKAPGFKKAREVQGGNYFVLRGGRNVAPTPAKFSSSRERHPRTGIGVTADGRVLMVTIDGRYSGSAGATLAEMGQLMRSLGAKHAFNLDGGGSTVMARFKPAVGRFAVTNRPSDGRQRPTSQAFVAYQVALGK